MHIKENAAIYLKKICLLRKTQSSIYKNMHISENAAIYLKKIIHITENPAIYL